jgi:hypothetical protein
MLRNGDEAAEPAEALFVQTEPMLGIGQPGLEENRYDEVDNGFASRGVAGYAGHGADIVAKPFKCCNGCACHA